MRILSYCVLIILGMSCAAKKMAIDHADTLLSRQVLKRLPLTSLQKKELDKDIDAFLNNTKPKAQEILPLFDEMTLADNTVVDSQYKRLEEFFGYLSQDFSALMSKYMSQLDSKQQKTFFKILNTENKEILKKDKVDRLQAVEDRLKIFIGTLGPEQKLLVSKHGDYFFKAAQSRVDRRKKLHARFKEIFKMEATPLTKKDLFQEAFVQYQRESFSQSKNLDILKELIPSLNQEQRSHFRQSAQEIKDLLKYFIQVDY